VCPACNGLAGITVACPVCGGMMTDRGPVSGFFGPYSPYDEADLLPAPVGETGLRPAQTHRDGLCQHLLACPMCGRDQRVEVALVEP